MQDSVADVEPAGTAEEANVSDRFGLRAHATYAHHPHHRQKKPGSSSTRSFPPAWDRGSECLFALYDNLELTVLAPVYDTCGATVNTIVSLNG